MSLRLVRMYHHLPIPKGADPESDSTEDEDTNEEEGTGETDAEGGEESSDDDKPVSRAEFQALFKRMQAADRAKTAAEAKIREHERAGQNELQKAQTDLEEANKKLHDLQEEVKTQRLQNAFLAANTVTWHDPEMAMSKIDLSLVLQDDGTVDNRALKTAITNLAKEKPFLVKKDGEDGGGKNGSTGTGVGSDLGGSKNTKGKEARELLEKKYPALRR